MMDKRSALLRVLLYVHGHEGPNVNEIATALGLTREETLAHLRRLVQSGRIQLRLVDVEADRFEWHRVK